MKKRLSITLILCISMFGAQAQNRDSIQIKALFDAALTEGKAYDWLNHLSNRIGGRLSGSVEAEQAVDYTKKELEALGLDKVWLQEVEVPKWVRGVPEFAYFETSPGVTTNIPICALGGSVATPSQGLKAEVVEVDGLEGLAALGEAKIKGKIVFFNRPMDATIINTFSSYSGCVDQRYSGARKRLSMGPLVLLCGL